MNIYQSLYDLINTYVYGNTIAVGSIADLVAMLISTLGCIYLVSLPFMLVYFVIKKLI